MVAERIERIALPAAVLVWAYLLLNTAHDPGGDFLTIYSGPHNLLRGLPFYPTTDHAEIYVARGEGFYVHPPSSPVVLAPLGALPARVAGAIFIVGSVMAFAAGLYRLARRTPFPALILLGAGLALPVRDILYLGNIDLLCAGLIAIAITTRVRYRTIPLAIAIAIKPTMWPVLILFGLDGLISVGIAAPFAIIGLLTIKEVGRFFDNVIPYLAHGQYGFGGPRASLTDAAVAAGLPRSPIAAICLAFLIALLGYIVWRVPTESRFQLAPLVVVATLVLSAYSFWIYAVYAIAVLPLLRPRDVHYPLLGIALYLIGSSDYWHSESLPDSINTISSFKTLGGLLLLVPIALTSMAHATRKSPAREV